MALVTLASVMMAGRELCVIQVLILRYLLARFIKPKTVYIESHHFPFLPDVNECTDLTHACVNGTCQNEYGSTYTCVCNSDWQGTLCDTGMRTKIIFMSIPKIDIHTTSAAIYFFRCKRVH